MKKMFLISIISLGLFFPACQSRGEKAAELLLHATDLLAEKQYADADHALDEILVLFPEDISALEMKLQIYTEQKSYDKIEKTSKLILAGNPHHDTAIEQLTQIYLVKNQKEKAFEIVQYGNSEKNILVLETLIDEKITALLAEPYTRFDIEKYYQYRRLQYKQYSEEISIGCALFLLLDQVQYQKNRLKSDEIVRFVKTNLENISVDVEMDSLSAIVQGYRIAQSVGKIEYKTCDELIQEIYHLDGYIAAARRLAQNQAGQKDPGFGLITERNDTRNKIFLQTVLEEKLAQLQ
ncbi:MAG: hypothetical protein JW904_02130 [Spirochaetales bacterium]|nr:hypothetical protein [Spirochaetales bacterium]